MRICLSIAVLLAAFCLNAQEVRDTVIYGDGWRYEGQWPEGEGCRYTSAGFVRGHFVEGKAEGMCTSTSYEKDNRYFGNYREGKRDGYGRLARPCGFFYEGEFKNGYPEGLGTMYFSDKFIFKGKFHLGKPQEGSYYYFDTRADYVGHLPEVPEMEVGKYEKKMMKTLRKKKKSDSVPEKEKNKIVPPTFLDGDANLFSKWVNGNLNYPPSAKATKREGKVTIKFTVTETGELADPYVIHGSGTPSLDCEAMRVVLQSPDWSPGMMDGEPVSVTYTFPTFFMLKGGN